MRSIEKDRYVLAVFDSLSDHYTTARKFPQEPILETGPEWIGLPNGSPTDVETVIAFLDKQNELAIEVEQMAEGLKLPVIGDIRRKGVWSEEGEELNMDRVSAGRLEVAWRTTRRKNCFTPPHIRVMVDLCCSAHEDSRTLKWRAIAGCALVQALRKKGYVVGVTGMIHNPFSDSGGGSRTRSEKLGYFIHLLKPGAPLNAAVLAQGLGCVNYRGLTFGIRRALRGGVDGQCYTNFAPQATPSFALQFAGISLKEKLLWVPGDCLSQTSAEEFLRESVSEIESLRA